MNEQGDDKLWVHFAPLWSEMLAVAPGTLLTGGYALFLKQKWLRALEGKGGKPLVAIDDWKDQVPRVTKEEFHAFPEERDDIRVEGNRVKPKLSLGKVGIHGRENPAAVGCALHPFRFTLANLEVSLPNPVTMAVMKLVAARDRRLASQNAQASIDRRAFESGQAQKHAQDVFRVVAMTTREENDFIPDILKQIVATKAYEAASNTYETLFRTDESWATSVVSELWKPNDLERMQSMLTAWFL